MTAFFCFKLIGHLRLISFMPDTSSSGSMTISVRGIIEIRKVKRYLADKLNREQTMSPSCKFMVFLEGAIFILDLWKRLGEF